MSTCIKICGLRDAGTALVAAASGADMIGFVFAPSKRRIEPEQAVEITGALRRELGAYRPLLVGLFVNESVETMRAIASLVGLDIIQLSGDEEPDADLLELLDLPVLRFLRVAPDETPAKVESLVQSWQYAARRADARIAIEPGPWGSRLLIGLDAYQPGAYGGTGHSADHALAAQLAADFPLMLAGGLNPNNVAATIARVKPWAVDVSSGVEENGAKSIPLIQSFIAAARGA